MTTAPMGLIIFGLAAVSLFSKPSIVEYGKLRCATNYWDTSVRVVQDDSLGHRLPFATLKPHETFCGRWEFRHSGRFLYVVNGDTLAGRWQ